MQSGATPSTGSGMAVGPVRLTRDLLAHALFAVFAWSLWSVVRQPPESGWIIPLDFTIYRQAMGHVVHDDVYEHEFLGLPFTYPPSALLILAPTGIPGELGQACWFLLNVAGLWMTLALVARAARPESWWSAPPGTSSLSAMALLTFPTMHALHLGQVTPLLMGLTAVATLGRRRPLDGAILGSAIAVKLTPALFVVWWWTVGRRRDAVLAAGTFLGLTVSAWILMPRSSASYYPALGLLDLAGNTPPSNPSNQSILGVLSRAGVAEPQLMPAAIVLGAFAAVFAVWVARRLTQRGWVSAAVPLVGIWSGMLAPLAWVHAFVWWIPLATAVALRGRRRVDQGVAVAIVIFTLVSPLAPSPGPDTIKGLLHGCAAALVTTWLAFRMRMESMAGTSSPPAGASAATDGT